MTLGTYFCHHYMNFTNVTKSRKSRRITLKKENQSFVVMNADFGATFNK